MVKAILFDLDGTLINSEHFYFDCWNEILTAWGPPLTYDDWLNNYAGTTIQTNAKKLIEKYNITTPLNELIEKREKLTIERFKTTDVMLMPYALEIIELFAARDIKMAIATSSLRKDVDAIFERNGLKHFFELIVTRSEVTNGKPHPESYNTCCSQLGILKNECIVFEDTINGLKAAKSAGLICYAIQNNVTEHTKLEIADRIFLDLNEAKNYLIETGQLN